MVLMKGRGSEEGLQKLDKKDHFSRRMSIPTKNLSSQQLLKAEEVSIVGSFKYKMHLVIQDYERGNS
jgi:hypothetical protein